jgi:outer membrane protein assembly factor BamD (BamD/ComL family)
MKKSVRALSMIVMAAIAIAALSCGGSAKYKDRGEVLTKIGQLVNEAKYDQVKAEVEYVKANAGKIKDMKAHLDDVELLLVNIQFLQQKYGSAVTACNEFIKSFPSSQYLPNVQQMKSAAEKMVSASTSQQ